MKKNKKVMTVRLPDKDIKVINDIAEREKKDKSVVARELLEMGRIYMAILEYKEGKCSIGRCAGLAGINLSRMIDLLSELGIESNLEVADYLEGKEGAKKVLS